MKFSTKIFISLIIIIAVAAVLRMLSVGNAPVPPYWEEVALGYDAYSLLRTGRDHHGELFPVVALKSFGDWKPALYAYLIVPFIALFGLSVEAIRLPSQLAGLSIVLALYILGKELALMFGSSLKQSRLIGLATSALAAVSPWLIILSRTAWETNLATAFVLWSVISLGYSTQQKFNHKKLGWLWSAILAGSLAAAAAYTYHATRVTAPILLIISWLTIVTTSVRNQVQIKSLLRVLLVSLTSFIIWCLPIGMALVSGDSVSHRLAETSIFTDGTTIAYSNQMKAQYDNSLISRLVYHRYTLYGIRMLKNITSFVSPDFLFISGDSNPRHSVQQLGQLYLIDSLLLLLGLTLIAKRNFKIFLLLLTWSLISLVPASITLGLPHALRGALLAPVLYLVITFGMVELWQNLKLFPLKLRILTTTSLIGLYSISVIHFAYVYSTVYPVTYAREWQAGYDQMIDLVNLVRFQQPQLPIYITREQGRPAMYYWFYSATDPKQVQASAQSARMDQGEFLEFEQIKFINSESEIDSFPNLLVASPKMSDQIINRLSPSSTTLIGTVEIAKTGAESEPIWVLTELAN